MGGKRRDGASGRVRRQASLASLDDDEAGIPPLKICSVAVSPFESSVTSVLFPAGVGANPRAMLRLGRRDDAVRPPLAKGLASHTRVCRLVLPNDDSRAPKKVVPASWGTERGKMSTHEISKCFSAGSAASHGSHPITSAPAPSFSLFSENPTPGSSGRTLHRSPTPAKTLPVWGADVAASKTKAKRKTEVHHATRHSCGKGMLLLAPTAMLHLPAKILHWTTAVVPLQDLRKQCG